MIESDDPFVPASEPSRYITVRDITADEILKKAAELIGQRFKRGEQLSSPSDVRRYLQVELAPLEQEVFACIFLDNRCRIIAFEKMFYGTIDGASVYPREIVRRCLHHNAASVIFSHNHPSGVAEPSAADERITTRTQKALALIDVRVIDHFVVGAEATVSFAERGLL